MTYKPTHYDDIHITPTFTKDGTEYKFEGPYYETRTSFRFIVLLLSGVVLRIVLVFPLKPSVNPEPPLNDFRFLTDFLFLIVLRFL